MIRQIRRYGVELKQPLCYERPDRRAVFPVTRLDHIVYPIAHVRDIALGMPQGAADIAGRRNGRFATLSRQLMPPGCYAVPEARSQCADSVGTRVATETSDDRYGP